MFLSQKHIIEEVLYTKKPSTKIESEDYETVETILFGTVTTVSKDGKKQMVNWAGRAKYVIQNNIDWKVLEYQVFVVSFSH
jgi:hemoglobin-like flavoprotein